MTTSWRGGEVVGFLSRISYLCCIDVFFFRAILLLSSTHNHTTPPSFFLCNASLFQRSFASNGEVCSLTVVTCENALYVFEVTKKERFV